jgi:hypothetical protein
MAANKSGEKHRKRFERWQARCGPQTRLLSKLVDEELVPVFIQASFATVDVAFRQADQTVNADEICLERAESNFFDTINISFSKRDRPNFQLGCSRRQSIPPNEFIRSCHLVKRSNQFYYFWGKPWWWPTALWSESQARGTVNKVKRVMEQLIVFVETGERGPNISRPTQRAIALSIKNAK